MNSLQEPLAKLRFLIRGQNYGWLMIEMKLERLILLTQQIMALLLMFGTVANVAKKTTGHLKYAGNVKRLTFG